jgi:phage-related protein
MTRRRRLINPPFDEEEFERLLAEEAAEEARLAAEIEAAKEQAKLEALKRAHEARVKKLSTILGPLDVGLIHQGKHWKVVAARAGNRFPAIEFLEEEMGVEAEVFKDLLVQLADTPKGHLAKESVSELRGVSKTVGQALFELRKDKGASRRAFRLFYIRHTHTKTKQKQLVLLNGFVKKTDDTPPSEISRAAFLRNLHIVENPRLTCPWLVWVDNLNRMLPWSRRGH